MTAVSEDDRLVAAREPLVAFNLQLHAPATIDDARLVASLVREGGARGLPGVRAIAIALGGAVLIESVFGLPGLGYLAIQSVQQFDLPKIIGVTVFASVMVIGFNLLVDLLYAWIDPRIRLS